MASEYTIPASVLLDTELEPTAKVVYAYVTTHKRTLIKPIQRALCLNFRTVKSGIAALVERGHLTYTIEDRMHVFDVPSSDRG